MPRYNSYNSHSVTAAVHQPAASYNTGYSYPVAPPPPVQPAAPSYYGNPPSSGYSYYGSGYGQAPIPPPSVPAYGQTYPPSYSNYYVRIYFSLRYLLSYPLLNFLSQEHRESNSSTSTFVLHDFDFHPVFFLPPPL